MQAQVYHVDTTMQLTLPKFSTQGKVIVTFLPDEEAKYIDSLEYKNDPVVFSGSGSEVLQYLDAIIAK